VRLNPLRVDEDMKVRCRAVCGVGHEPIGLNAEGASVLSIIVCDAPTSACRIARDASTSMMMPNFTSMRELSA
jgi:hypothetical protein